MRERGGGGRESEEEDAESGKEGRRIPISRIIVTYILLRLYHIDKIKAVIQVHSLVCSTTRKRNDGLLLFLPLSSLRGNRAGSASRKRLSLDDIATANHAPGDSKDDAREVVGAKCTSRNRASFHARVYNTPITPFASRWICLASAARRSRPET